MVSGSPLLRASCHSRLIQDNAALLVVHHRTIRGKGPPAWNRLRHIASLDTRCLSTVGTLCSAKVVAYADTSAKSAFDATLAG